MRQRVSSWLDSKLAELDAAPKTEKPPVTNAEIEKTAKDLQAFAKPLLDRPKPAPKKEEKEEAAAEAEPEAQAEAQPEAQAEAEAEAEPEAA